MNSIVCVPGLASVVVETETRLSAVKFVELVEVDVLKTLKVSLFLSVFALDWKSDNCKLKP